MLLRRFRFRLVDPQAVSEEGVCGEWGVGGLRLGSGG
jgi:hypothetical protein